MGRPKLSKQRFSACLQCGKRFGWLWHPYRGEDYRQRFCSRKCQATSTTPTPRKLPDNESIKRLFIGLRMSRRAIARLYGVSDFAVAGMLRRYNIYRKDDHGEKNNPPRDYWKVVRMYRSGMSMLAIARSFPCSHSHIRNILLRCGEPIRAYDPRSPKISARKFVCPFRCQEYECIHYRVHNAERNKQRRFAAAAARQASAKADANRAAISHTGCDIKECGS